MTKYEMIQTIAQRTALDVKTVKKVIDSCEDLLVEKALFKSEQAKIIQFPNRNVNNQTNN